MMNAVHQTTQAEPGDARQACPSPRGKTTHVAVAMRGARAVDLVDVRPIFVGRKHIFTYL
jgi:hypothetical protein